MPWTEITRSQYLRSGLRYASDMTDAEWRLIARRLPPRRRLGRPRKVDLRKVVEAILYILSTGCQWRALPQRVPAILDGPGLFLRLARHWQVAQDRQSAGSASAPEAWTQTESRPPRSSTAKALRRHTPAGRAALTPANASMAASATSLPIPMASCWRSMFILPTFRMSTVLFPCWSACEAAFPSCGTSLPIGSIAANSLSTRSPIAGRGQSRSSSDHTASKASSSCPDAGSSNAPSHGSADAVVSPRTSRAQPLPKSHGFSSPISGS